MEFRKEYYTYKNFVDLSYQEKILVHNWRNNDSIRKWMFNQDAILLNDHLQFIQSLTNSKTKKYWLVLRNKKPVGTTSIIDIIGNCAEWGYYIGPEYHETSTGVEFYYFTLSFLFDNIKLEKVYGYELRTNKGASSLNSLFGFSKQDDIKIINGKKLEVNYRELQKDFWREHVKNAPKIVKLINFALTRT